jgi:GT2 family glycosyltransferase
VPKPLAIIPNYVTEAMDLEVIRTCIETMRGTVGDACDLMVVDDGSPAQDYAQAVKHLTEEAGGVYHGKDKNQGFSKTVNIGLRRALQEGRDAILVNADIEFLTDTWLDLMLKQKANDDSDRLASIVGALLVYPNGLIQHAGIFFSLLYREFDHIYRYAPADLPEARQARTCPVTGALQFIRHECLAELGVYDEDFRMGWEDVDYTIRAWNSGRSIVMQPGVKAIHHESFFRGRSNTKVEKWQQESWLYFCRKHANQSFAEFVPSLI